MKKIRKRSVCGFFFLLIFCLAVLTGCKSSESGKNEKDEKKQSCTISIVCQSILEHKDELKEEKKDYVPEDGVILKETEVTFSEGDTVFDILKKVCKEHKIQIESSQSATYQSVYIEGIHQLYEFDCGPSSGWMYRVNGTFPNYGCSKIKAKQGDKIEWIYTCELGNDIGAKNENQK